MRAWENKSESVEPVQHTSNVGPKRIEQKENANGKGKEKEENKKSDDTKKEENKKSDDTKKEAKSEKKDDSLGDSLISTTIITGVTAVSAFTNEACSNHEREKIRQKYSSSYIESLSDEQLVALLEQVDLLESDTNKATPKQYKI